MSFGIGPQGGGSSPGSEWMEPQVLNTLSTECWASFEFEIEPLEVQDFEPAGECSADLKFVLCSVSLVICETRLYRRGRVGRCPCGAWCGDRRSHRFG